MAVAIVQTASGVGTATLASTPTPGNLLLVVCALNTSSPITLPVGVTAVSYTFPTVNTNVSMMMGTRVVQAGDAAAWSYVGAGDGYEGIVVYEISGAGAIDQLVAAGYPGNSPYTGPSATASVANSLALSGGSSNNAASAPWGWATVSAGWSSDANAVTQNYRSVFTAHKTTSPGSGSAFSTSFGTGTTAGGAVIYTMNFLPAAPTGRAGSGIHVARRTWAGR